MIHCRRPSAHIRHAAGAAALVTLAFSVACRSQTAAVATGQAPPPHATSGPIGALGRVEAGDGIVMVGARSLSGQPSIVGRLLVKEGGSVSAQQVVAELDSLGQLQAAERQAAARTEVARRRLAQVQAHGKPADIAAQRAEMERLEAELANAQEEQKRYSSLGDNVTAAQLDTLRLRVDATTLAVEAARQRLASLSDVRPVDVELARAEVDEAIRNEARARAEREASLIRSPIDGRVVKIHSKAGEQVQPEGIMELAPTDPMYVIAEVAESDISRVKVGQRATVSGDGLPAPVLGAVERIAPAVLQNQLMHVDPATFSDGRVVNVWIKLDNGATVANLIHMRTDVVIQP